jgi:hypothetical protein
VIAASTPLSGGTSESDGRTHWIADVKHTADKRQRDQASLGDLKLLCRAIRELRDALKIFRPYRRIK